MISAQYSTLVLTKQIRRNWKCLSVTNSKLLMREFSRNVQLKKHGRSGEVSSIVPLITLRTQYPHRGHHRAHISFRSSSSWAVTLEVQKLWAWANSEVVWNIWIRKKGFGCAWRIYRFTLVCRPFLSLLFLLLCLTHWLCRSAYVSLPKAIAHQPQLTVAPESVDSDGIYLDPPPFTCPHLSTFTLTNINNRTFLRPLIFHPFPFTLHPISSPLTQYSVSTCRNEVEVTRISQCRWSNDLAAPEWLTYYSGKHQSLFLCFYFALSWYESLYVLSLWFLLNDDTSHHVIGSHYSLW